MNENKPNGKNLRLTPSYIETLQPDEVFVFGSNERGSHGAGAALTAYQKFGAVMGEGEGLFGQSYALPTMEGVENVKKAVARFTEFAKNHPDLKFLVTRVGCGIAGYTDKEIAPMFREASELPNVSIPESFWSVLKPC